MTFNQLRYVVILAQKRNFRAAADACLVSQPTLSVSIKKLEEELGTSLFERNSTDIEVTVAGLEVVERAKRIIEESELISQISKKSKDALDGAIRFGVIQTVAPSVLPSLIPELRGSAPKMPLYIHENSSEELIRRLKNGELDVVMMSLPVSESSLEVLPIYEEPFVVAIPDGHRWADQETISVDDFNSVTTILLPIGHCFRDQVLSSCPASYSVTGSPCDSEAPTLESVRHMVAGGVGVSILPRSSLGSSSYDEDLVRFKRFSDPAPSRVIGLVWRSSFSRVEAIDHLVESLMSCGIPGVNYIYDEIGNASEESH